MITKLRIRNRILNVLPFIGDLKESITLGKFYRSWRRNGMPIPAPQPVKRAMLAGEAKRIGAETFVETGTFTADTVWFMKDTFQEIFSIEVEPTLAKVASARFRKYPHIRIIRGDSAEILDTIMTKIVGSTLFWLDGHYSAGITGRGSKDCPIFEELAAIAKCPPPRFSIVIDDLRYFGTDPAYPTFEEISRHINEVFPSLRVTTELDMIWCRG